MINFQEKHKSKTQEGSSSLSSRADKKAVRNESYSFFHLKN